ncbi:hypothetical protein EON65_02030 [archaeon]|nr:MAG: hypothetical protein EON65_02030 [archaeon]
MYFTYILAPSPRKNSNAISTTKYTWYSWLPKSIWEQFRRIANVYFLLISILMVSRVELNINNTILTLHLVSVAYWNLRHLSVRLAS